MNYLVETKAEYTSQLINIVCPFIYDGIQSLYDEALKVARDNEELKIFQSFLKKIPTWNPLILESETTRILKDSECLDLLPNLLNAVIKSNIMVLTNTPPEKKYTIKLPKDIDFKKFIHFSYIETAKMIYNNPYLFYHKYSLYDIKKNQRDAQDNIKYSIHEAIRKLLPLQYILNEYLGENTPTMPKEQDFDKGLSDANKNILQKMIKKQELINNDLTGLQPSTTGLNNELEKIREMLKNDPLDSAIILDSESDSDKFEIDNKNECNNNNNPEKCNNQVSNLIIENPIPKKIEPLIDSESIAYYKNNNSKILDSFSNKSNIRSLFYSNDPVNQTKNLNQKSVNTNDVENYLKDQGQTTIVLSDDPNINSIKNIKTDKFKNKYYQV